MSHQMTVILSNARIPSVQQLNDEMRRLELPCKIVNSESFLLSYGSLTCRIEHMDVEKEIVFEDSSWLEEIPELKNHAGNRDRCFDFPLGSDMSETIIVTAICTAFISLSDAILYYQPDDLYYSLEESLQEVQSALSHLQKQMKKRK